MDKYNILITGCSSGLGNYLVKKFELEGHLILKHMGRMDKDLSLTKQTLELAELAREFGVNMLINNAAIVCPNMYLNEYNVDMIEDMINVDLTAPILLTNSLLPNLKKIININSMVGLEIKSPRTLYSATKWGLRGFSNSLKKENSNIDILDVYPTNIKTTPDKINAMNVEEVVDKIYNAFDNNLKDLVLDGRPK